MPEPLCAECREMADEPEPGQNPDPWAVSIEKGTAPKPKEKEEDSKESWKSFRPGEAEPLPQDLNDKSRASGSKKKGWGSSSQKAQPSGPNLARTRVSEEIVKGHVLEWKGKYGWILPMAPVQHPKAFKHQGKIFISQTDLDGKCRALAPGIQCEFYIFEDEAGIGAEKCKPVERPTSTSKGGKKGAWPSAQSGGSRPSADHDRLKGRKGDGAKGGKGPGAPHSSPLGQGGGFPMRPHDGPGAASIGAGAQGKGGRDFDAGRGGQKGSLGQGAGGFGKGKAKGGFSGSDAMQAPFGQVPHPQFGKGADAKSGGRPQINNAVPSGANSNGAGMWDAYNSNQHRPPPAQSMVASPFMNQSAFANHAAVPEPLLQQQNLQQGFAGMRELIPFFGGSSPDASSLPDPMMGQSLFADPNRGLQPMVPYSPGADLQGWDSMSGANMQAYMAAGGAGSLISPSYGYAAPGSGFAAAPMPFQANDLMPAL